MEKNNFLFLLSIICKDENGVYIGLVNICKKLGLIAKLLKNSTLPLEWREYNVTTILKSGSRTEIGKYRPVSLTSVICKIIESNII